MSPLPPDPSCKQLDRQWSGLEMTICCGSAFDKECRHSTGLKVRPVLFKGVVMRCWNGENEAFSIPVW
jgi:hypothetical protein